jgi:hypothetical protein
LHDEKLFETRFGGGGGRHVYLDPTAKCHGHGRGIFFQDPQHDQGQDHQVARLGRYGSFDIGKGIVPGETLTLKWDKKTNDTGCKWYFKAVFDGGDESEAKKFDFCEEDLELEF